MNSQPQSIIQLHLLWTQFKSVAYNNEGKELKDFLQLFVHTFADGENNNINLLPYTYSFSKDTRKELERIFISNIHAVLKARGKQGIVDYFTDASKMWLSLHLLFAIELLTKATAPFQKSVEGMASTLVIVLRELLQNIASYQLQIEPSQIPPHFTTYSFPPIHCLYAVPLIPACLSTLFASSSSSSSTFTASTRIRTAVESQDNSFIATVCYHLLSCLMNLFAQPETFYELMDFNQFHALLDILSITTKSHSDYGLIIHKQLVRALCAMVATATEHVKQIHSLKHTKFFSFVLSALKTESSLSTVIILELCQMLIFAVQKSTNICAVLFDEFQQEGGYAIVAEKLILIGKLGTKEERVSFISSVCHLLFVAAESSSAVYNAKRAKGETLSNIDTFRVLLTAFENSESNSEMKTELLHTIGAIFSLDKSREGLAFLEQLAPFKVFFLQFDSLNLSNRNLILKMMEEVLQRGEILAEELHSYCLLLQGKRSSTILLAARHMMALLEHEFITREQIRRAGIIPILTEYISNPLDYTCAQVLKTDPDELQLTLSLLSNAPLHSIAVNDTAAVEQHIKDILYSLALKIMELLRAVLANNADNQLLFRDSGGVKKLYGLLGDGILRKAALQVTALVAVGDATLDSKIVPDLITCLQSSGGTASLDSNILKMRKDILATLCYIFRHNVNTKNAFRVGGGFIWAISVLDGIGRCMDTLQQKDILFSSEADQNNASTATSTTASTSTTAATSTPSSSTTSTTSTTTAASSTATGAAAVSGSSSATVSDSAAAARVTSSETEEEIFSFLKILLHTLSVVLTANAANQNYFREDIHFSTLSETLQSCSFIEGQRTVELCDCLLNIAVKGTWPPSCAQHHPILKLLPPWHPQSIVDALVCTDSSSLSQARILVTSCTHCKESLFLENPEICKLIIQLLSSCTKRKSNEKHSYSGYYIYVLKILSFIADALPFNQHKLSSIGIVSEIIDCFNKYLLEATSLQAHLLSLIQKIAVFHISLLELQKYYTLMKNEDFPINILDNLIDMSKRKNEPTYFADFSKHTLGNISIPSLGERTWPPVKGYSIAFWIQISQFAADETDICVFSFEGYSKNNKHQCSISSSGVLKYQVSPKDSIAFADFTFQTSKWYHVVLSHSPPKQQKKAIVKLYIDGILKGQDYLQFIKAQPSRLSGRFGNAQGYPYSLISWQLSSVFFFEDVLSNREIFQLYVIGPNYSSGFETEPALFQQYDHINPKNIRMHGELVDSIFSLTDTITSLQDKLLFVLCVRNMVIAQTVRIPFFPTGTANTQSSITKTLAPTYAKMNSSYKYLNRTPAPSAASSVLCSPPASVWTRTAVKDALYNLGGISTVIYLISMMQHSEYQRSAIQLLHVLLQFNAKNVREMESICGYEIIGRLMRKEHWSIDEAMLSTVFRLVGLKKSMRTPTYSTGVVANLSAFKYILLDWNIWQRTTFPVQKLLFETLAELVSIHEYSAFNIRRFREANVVPTLFHIFREHQDSLPVGLGPYFITIIRSTMSEPPTAADLKMILNYLISTLQSSTHMRNYGAAIAPSPSKTLAASSSAPSVALSADNNNNTRTPRRIESVDSIDKKAQQQHREEHSKGLSIRTYVLKMLLDILVQGSTPIIEQFAEICNLETLFSLLRTESLPTRVLLLKILDLFLRIPSIASLFDAMRGFALLGSQLFHFTVSEELFSVLFCMLLGKPAYKYDVAASSTTSAAAASASISMRGYFMGIIKEDVSIAHPAAVIPILNLVGSEFISPELQNTVIKTLHDLFLQSDAVKELFLNNDLIKLLCDIFVFESRKKRGIRPSASLQASSSDNALDVPSNTSAAPHTSATDASAASNAAVEVDKLWRAEEDVLGFLKAIALHGCISFASIALLDEILLTMDLLHLPVNYLKTIQRRILFDALLFFHDNFFLNNNLLVSTFKQLCILACNYLCYDEVNEAEDSEWKAFSGTRSETEFIKLLFEVLSQSRNRSVADTSHNYLPFFAAQYGIQLQFGRLILHLLHSKKRNSYLLWALTQMSNNSALIADFTSNEEFIVRLFVYSQPCFSEGGDIARETWKIWQAIFRSKKSFLKNIFTVVPSTADEAQQSIFQPQTMSDIKRVEDREALAAKEWLAERQALREKKHQHISKNQERIKSNHQLTTHTLLSLQQQQTKSIIEHVQTTMEREKTLRVQWKMIHKRVTHERAVWRSEEKKYWKLDPTEGTHRMRIRLKQSETRLPFLTPCSVFSSKKQKSSHNNSNQLLSPAALNREASEKLELVALGGEELPHDFIKPGERIINHFKCCRINPFSKRDGELLIGETFIYFIDDQKVPLNKKNLSNPKNLNWSCESIKEIHKRRYLLKNNAMEVFLTNGKTYLLAFEQPAERDTAYEQIMTLNLPNRVDYESEVGGGMLKLSITQKWKRGLISNFEYLMHLNTIAGRSFNDLTQYPVFPVILADYTSKELDLSNSHVFRDLQKPMGAQDPERLAKFEERYKQLIEMGEEPFHYGSHYSNIGSVLHFLVRLEPFSRYFIEFQGGRFDVPDRAFHSLHQMWLLSSALSSSDVKELIPEFFFLPEFLTNHNRFDLGVKQDGQRVDDVVLPPWALNSARVFIKKHREALESSYVSSTLHHWIDLMFGYKQQGEEAVAAKNVFHPLTYEGAVDIDSIQDKVTKEATIAQISSYGQTPKQLFKRPHPERDADASNSIFADAIFTHPERLSPYPMWSTSSYIGRLALIDDAPIALGANRVLIYPKGDQVISWGNWDQSLRICALDTGKVLSVIESIDDEDTLCGDMPINGSVLVTGGTSCIVKVWKRSRTAKTKSGLIQLHSLLYGHTEPIHCICVSQEWSVILSGSADKTCIMWDLNRLSYVRTLAGHTGTVTAVAISPNTGDIVTIDDTPKGSTLRLWSVNGFALGKNSCTEKILCVKFTAGTEGLCRNIVITGLQTGCFKIWSAWDLSFIIQLEGGHKSPITAIAVTSDHTQLISGDESGLLVCWSCRKPREVLMPI